MYSSLSLIVFACSLAGGFCATHIGTLMSAASPEYFLAVFSDKNDQFVAGLHLSSKQINARRRLEGGIFEYYLGRDSSPFTLLLSYSTLQTLYLFTCNE
jgi:hypothetical protein